MDNRALEKYRAEHPTTTQHRPVEPAEFDPFDDHFSTTEIAVCVAIGLVLIYSVGQMIFGKKK